jgi:hypothetical protein
MIFYIRFGCSYLIRVSLRSQILGFEALSRFAIYSQPFGRVWHLFVWRLSFFSFGTLVLQVFSERVLASGWVSVLVSREFLGKASGIWCCLSKSSDCNDAVPRKGCRYWVPGQARRGLGCPCTITFVLFTVYEFFFGFLLLPVMVPLCAQLQVVLGPCLTRRTSSVCPCSSMTLNRKLRLYINYFTYPELNPQGGSDEEELSPQSYVSTKCSMRIDSLLFWF